MFGFIYLIYSRFMSDIIEDLIYLAEVNFIYFYLNIKYIIAIILYVIIDIKF